MCPIPDFDHNHVMPPHLGSPVDKSQLSPYQCSILELCHKFSTSPERIEILKGLVSFRQKMNVNGIVFGFQWLDGSFLEDIEILEKRAPRDLDILTYYRNLNSEKQADIRINFPEFANSSLSKASFLLDHYPIDYAFQPELTVELTRYWLQLFTHNRNNVWKGMLRLAINTPIDDQYAMDYLNSL